MEEFPGGRRSSVLSREEKHHLPDPKKIIINSAFQVSVKHNFFDSPQRTTAFFKIRLSARVDLTKSIFSCSAWQLGNFLATKGNKNETQRFTPSILKLVLVSLSGNFDHPFEYEVKATNKNPCLLMDVMSKVAQALTRGSYMLIIRYWWN